MDTQNCGCLLYGDDYAGTPTHRQYDDDDTFFELEVFASQQDGGSGYFATVTGHVSNHCHRSIVFQFENLPEGIVQVRTALDDMFTRKNDFGAPARRAWYQTCADFEAEWRSNQLEADQVVMTTPEP